jgi:hypothetical protein
MNIVRNNTNLGDLNRKWNLIQMYLNSAFQEAFLIFSFCPALI